MTASVFSPHTSEYCTYSLGAESRDEPSSNVVLKNSKLLLSLQVDSEFPRTHQTLKILVKASSYLQHVSSRDYYKKRGLSLPIPTLYLQKVFTNRSRVITPLPMGRLLSTAHSFPTKNQGKNVTVTL